MATTAEIRNGLCIRHNEKLFQVIEFQHVKPGKGPAFVRTKMRQIETGRVIDNTFLRGIKLKLCASKTANTNIFIKKQSRMFL